MRFWHADHHLERGWRQFPGRKPGYPERGDMKGMTTGKDLPDQALSVKSFLFFKGKFHTVEAVAGKLFFLHFTLKELFDGHGHGGSGLGRCRHVQLQACIFHGLMGGTAEGADRSVALLEFGKILEE
jgi:hypothetical protein